VPPPSAGILPSLRPQQPFKLQFVALLAPLQNPPENSNPGGEKENGGTD